MKNYFKFAILVVIGFISADQLSAQAPQNFAFTPEKPKPGEVIKITYTPAGDIANTMGKVEGLAYLYGSGDLVSNDLVFTKAGKKYTATLQTDATQNFIQLGFYVDTKYDNNYNDGYFIELYCDGKACKGSKANLAAMYQYLGYRTQVERNADKAITAYEQEFGLYPEQKKSLGFSYLQLLSNQKKDGFQALVEKEIEASLKSGLKAEDDYSFVGSCYRLAKFPEQAKWFDSLMKVSFPNGKWQINAKYMQFSEAKDAEKKAAVLAEIKKKIETDPSWKSVKQSVPYFESNVLSGYIKSKNWDLVRKSADQMSDKSTVASAYNSAAWQMQEKNEDLSIAEEFSKYAIDFTKAEASKPSSPKPSYLTVKQWNKQRESTYAMYADTYAMTQFRLNDPKKGFPYAVEASKTINKGEDADLNNTYTLLAEKILPPKELKLEVESFVKAGKATGAMKEILKKLYVREKTSDAGFDEYLKALEKESYLKMVDELRKSMLKESAPGFALRDLQGKTVAITDLKGKIVVADFWATWCGPCKASFPTMQKMVEKYKDNDDIRFVFIDTWERGETKSKNAEDFIATNRYTFHVLMDDDNKVVEQFKVDGIPNEFVIDKTGAIRFKSIGFNNDEKLISELTAMIDMVGGEKIN